MSIASYQTIPIQENNEPLVDLSSFDFILDPIYFNRGFTTNQRMFLRVGVAKKLQEIQKDLKIYKFKIWDGFRPREVQNTLYKSTWEEFKLKHPEWDENKLAIEVGTFVTPPHEPGRIPPHATGGAVDLTLVDQVGKELDMGTDFDYFGPEASPLYFEENAINETVRKNRKIFREAMLAIGFMQYPEEWWHFDYGDQLWAMKSGAPLAIYGEIKL